MSRLEDFTSGAPRPSSETPLLSAAPLFLIEPIFRIPVFGASAVGGTAKPGNTFSALSIGLMKHDHLQNRPRQVF